MGEAGFHALSKGGKRIAQSSSSRVWKGPSWGREKKKSWVVALSFKRKDAIQVGGEKACPILRLFNGENNYGGALSFAGQEKKKKGKGASN